MTPSTPSRVGVSLPMLDQPYERYAEFATLAEDAGFDSVWDYEFYRALNARVTARIQLGTGIATAAPRTPYEMANAAADVDELSGHANHLGSRHRRCGLDGMFQRRTCRRSIERQARTRFGRWWRPSRGSGRDDLGKNARSPFVMWR